MTEELSTVLPPDGPDAIKERVEAALAELVAGIDPDASPSEQADAIAVRLLAAGARGPRRESDGCPLAAYLSRRTSWQVNVSMAEWWIYYHDPSHPAPGINGSVSAPLPPAASAFVDRYDDGMAGLYPELEPDDPSDELDEAEEG